MKKTSPFSTPSLFSELPQGSLPPLASKGSSLASKDSLPASKGSSLASKDSPPASKDSLPPSAAHLLEGKTLQDGWVVTEKLKAPPVRGGTGGTFSVGYIVKNGNQQCFLKAIDISGVIPDPSHDSAQRLQPLEAMVAAYNHELGVLTECISMSRVITLVGDGQIRVEEAGQYPDVFYLILEKADGDVRDANLPHNFDDALKCRVLHHIALAIEQLQSAGIHHRDIKPSNVLIVEGESAKIGDLGVAVQQGRDSRPLTNGGDITYYPPEYMYGEGVDEQSLDLYHLGSMACFMFMRNGITHLVLSKLEPKLRPHSWRKHHGGFQAILPHLLTAFSDVLQDIKQCVANEKAASVLVSVIKETCHPDPKNRGIVSRVDRFSSRRYVSIFDRLAKEFEIKLRKSLC